MFSELCKNINDLLKVITKILLKLWPIMPSLATVTVAIILCVL